MLIIKCERDVKCVSSERWTESQIKSDNYRKSSWWQFVKDHPSMFPSRTIRWICPKDTCMRRCRAHGRNLNCRHQFGHHWHVNASWRYSSWWNLPERSCRQLRTEFRIPTFKGPKEKSNTNQKEMVKRRKRIIQRRWCCHGIQRGKA